MKLWNKDMVVPDPLQICAVELGQGDERLDRHEGLTPLAAAAQLSLYYDTRKDTVGCWCRVTVRDTIALMWYYESSDQAMPFWYGTDQMFGLLCQIRSWADVAFFVMQADGDLKDVLA